MRKQTRKFNIKLEESIMETNEIMVNDVNEELNYAIEADQEVESEGGIANTVGGVAVAGLALYGVYTLGKKAISGGKKAIGHMKDFIAAKKAEKESEATEPDAEAPKES
jgi:hypothetical protein